MPAATASLDSLGARATLEAGGRAYDIWRLDRAAAELGRDLDRLPFTLRVLFENLLRGEDGEAVTRGQIEALASWDARAEPSREIAFRPARVLLQDFTGVPAVVDLAAMRDAMADLGGDPARINPGQPVDLVIDHSVQVDEFGSDAAYLLNVTREFERNGERYRFLRWGQQAFEGFRVVPPGTGIVHQVNLEYLAPLVFAADGQAYPDTLVGTDSHTTMINGLGVLGWGVGGIEAEAAMLGQPVSMLIPRVFGVRLTGELPEGATGADLVLRVTELLRARDVVGSFVEFFGPGLSRLPLASRATIANMCPEYGATVGFFPVDEETLRYLRFTGRPEEAVALAEAYCREQRLFRGDDTPDPEYSELLEIDLGAIEPSIAGPRRPQDRIALGDAKQAVRATIAEEVAAGAGAAPVAVARDGGSYELSNGSIVIAAITSCTNTSNPEVMVGAGLLARNAVARGLRTPPWVKTSLAPGSRVVTGYLAEAGLTEHLDALGFHLVGYGCTTCIGNSGPLPPEVSAAVEEGSLAVAAVLSGNRNFEARISNQVRANYLASPPLVVAYALAGHMDVDLASEPLGAGPDGRPVYLREIWPSGEEIAETIRSSIRSSMFRERYADVFAGDERWAALGGGEGARFAWDEESTYVRRAPYFDGLPREPAEPADIAGARVLALLGDSVTTDHISPAGAIAADSPAGEYLRARGVERRDFNSYGSRRGNHEVMVRGAFANVRLRNRLVGREGGWTRHLPDGAELPIHDAAEHYRAEGVPLIVIAGREYGSGSSRDWAAKGPALLGVRAVIAESFERIHRSNLIGMGILPLEFPEGASAASLGLDGREAYDVSGVAGGAEPGQDVAVRAVGDGGREVSFTARCRIDTPVEAEYWRHGGILPCVLRGLLEE